MGWLGRVALRSISIYPINICYCRWLLGFSFDSHFDMLTPNPLAGLLPVSTNIALALKNSPVGYQRKFLVNFSFVAMVIYLLPNIHVE